MKKYFNQSPMQIFIKALPAVALVLSLASVMSGCGVRQFGAKLRGLVNQPSVSETVAGFGPFHSSGQGGGSMSASACAPGVGHHPCARARASVGMPYQFDVNPNSAQGAITSGTAYVPGAYVGTAGLLGTGAGKTAAAAGKPRMENRDLHIMKRQTAASDQSF